MSEAGKHKVFVYGTLKSGEPNYEEWLTNPDKGQVWFITTAITLEKYPLCIASKYNIPVLLDRPGTGYNIHGEIYEVDDQKLAQLDILEEHPTLYERVVREMQDSSGNVHKCWIYLLKNFKPELLEGPFLENYSSTGTHGLPYVPCEIDDDNVEYTRQKFVDRV